MESDNPTFWWHPTLLPICGYCPVNNEGLAKSNTIGIWLFLWFHLFSKDWRKSLTCLILTAPVFFLEFQKPLIDDNRIFETYRVFFEICRVNWRQNMSFSVACCVTYDVIFCHQLHFPLRKLDIYHSILRLYYCLWKTRITDNVLSGNTPHLYTRYLYILSSPGD